MVDIVDEDKIDGEAKEKIIDDRRGWQKKYACG